MEFGNSFKAFVQTCIEYILVHQDFVAESQQIACPFSAVFFNAASSILMADLSTQSDVFHLLRAYHATKESQTDQFPGICR